ncbi:MAG: tyrosine-type recombinase/integrase [Acutalibacteraceae bacterium]
MEKAFRVEYRLKQSGANLPQSPRATRILKRLKAQKVGQGLLTHRIYPHLLRHTFATSYRENGGNIYALQQILGHTTLDMVKKHVHLT